MKPDHDRTALRAPRRAACCALTVMLGLCGAWSAVTRAAEVTARRVVETCERAIAGGYRDMDAAMCDWQVRPCGVCGVAAVAEWCVPGDLDPATLAGEVVAGLRAARDLDGPAKPQVEEILRAHYPCAAQDGHHDQLVDP